MTEHVLHAGNTFILERDTSSQTRGSVVLKYPTSALPPPGALARLDREYKVGSSLKLPSVRRVLNRVEWKGRPANELEYISGKTFKSYFGPVEHRQLATVLKLALSAASALESLHTAGVVHRDIAATNLLVTDDGERAVIIDLEFATRIGEENHFVTTAEGQLPYLSPEQTGRIALPVDERSDLYAFGVLFYEMLTGKLPFQAKDVPGWIHSHLARRPMPPNEHLPEIPAVVSDIVLRLLAKAPDQRYQTARGLSHDLTKCLNRLDRDGTIPGFTLGYSDHSGRLHFSSSLYGRGEEREHLLAALKQAANGHPGLEFISGYVGAGKTTLVNELRFPVAAAGGRFISGKFDQSPRPLPYAAFNESFSQLCHQLLGGTPDELEAFRSRVLEALGLNAGLLLEFVPELEAVIGSQPLPQTLETAASANRFTLTLLNFFNCLAAAEHPLVLFLDDLQWADSASLDLLYMIATRTLRRHFLIICAYRDTQLSSRHPLPAVIENVKRECPNVGNIALGGLNLKQATELIAGALDASADVVAPLAEVIHAKTGGNPFFLRQVLDSLVNEGVLHFDAQSGSWQWDATRVRALDISDNVLKFMLRKIARLPTDVRRLLQAAACIGNTFSLDLLEVAADIDKEKPKQLLLTAIEGGLVALIGNTARFTHDRIQQAVYQTLTSQEAQGIHLRLGRYLLSQKQEQDIPLVAVRQLNFGSDLIESAEERRRLAELNLQTGETACAAMAYGEARDFFAMGEDLLDATETDDSTLLYELRLRQAETAFYIGDVTNSLRRLYELMQTTADISFRVRIYQMLIDIHTVELQPGKALAIGREALERLGVVIPEGDSVASVEAGIEEIDRILGKLDIDRITDWPEMRNEHELAIAGTLTHLVAPAYISAADEFPFIVVEFVRRTLNGELSPFSAYAFCLYGMLLAAVMSRFDSASRMGQLAIDIAQRADGLGLRGRVNFLHALCIMHWSEPLEATLPVLDRAWKAGVETGDLQIASYCINHIHGNALLAGKSLIELEQSLDRFAEVHRVIRQEEYLQGFHMTIRLIEELRYPSDTDALPDLLSDHGGMEKVLNTWNKTDNKPLLSIYYLMKCLLALVMEKTDEAFNAMTQMTPVIEGILGTTWLPQHHFFYVLVQADAVREGRLTAAEAVSRTDGLCKALEDWAKACPKNYLAKLLLVKAEIADLVGENPAVMLDAYDQAIDAAAQADRTLDQALACERAAGYWTRSDKPRIAMAYLQQAVESYKRWGAEAKVERLLHKRALPLPPQQFCARDTNSLATSSSSGEELHTADIHSVLKAAQTVAGELVMDRMLAHLLGLVIETAGAQCGYLLFEQMGEWLVVAEQRPERTDVEVLQWRPLEECPGIATSVVQYVARTQKSINLDDASKSTLFASDTRIATSDCKSLLCLPIINRGELAGILYLENNLATHAFTRTQTRILQLLTTQAISSLEISRYYARVQNLNHSLEEEIKERKRTESQLEFLANHDPLTNLPNRRLIYDRVQHSIQRAQRGGNRVAVLFLDLDQFKNVNDTLSHQVGDRLLQQVAKRLTKQVREEDTLGRLGGDEYVLLMEGKLNLHDLSVVADKLLSAFRDPFTVDSHELHPTASLGISLFPEDAADADQLLRYADAAMYQAKQLGRNCFHFFSARLAEAAAERLALERDLRHAIEREEFELYFQPQVELKSGKIIGAEVVLRWNHPSRGLMLPQSFIPLAEETGSINSLGEWVLRSACRQLNQWRREGIELERLAVNVSGGQFTPQGEFAALVKRILEQSDIDPANLELELTESVILQDSENTLRSLADINALGVQLAIDDFGTGYSSLSYLHRLPVHRLKIDRSFVSNLPHAHDSAMIVQSIMLLGSNLGKQIIAEGIEAMEQKHFLQQAGCIEGQGYLFGAPMPLMAFTKLLPKFRL
ncbi:MAG: EAL domain-containing protein [Candidatus Thiodiazotropha sp.]